MTGKRKMGIKLLMIALGTILLISSIFTSCTTQKETLTFADLNWDSAQVHNRIAAFILEHGYGYDIAYNFGATIPMFVGLEDGINEVAPHGYGWVSLWYSFLWVEC